MAVNNIIDSKPWYKYFWPWFFIFVVVWTFISAAGMLYFATTNSPSLVSGYNKIAKFISDEQSLKIANAQKLDIKIQLIRQDNILTINISPAKYAIAKNFTLDLIHPTNAQQDIHLSLTQKNNSIQTLIPANIAEFKILLTNNKFNFMVELSASATGDF